MHEAIYAGILILHSLFSMSNETVVFLVIGEERHLLFHVSYVRMERQYIRVMSSL